MSHADGEWPHNDGEMAARIRAFDWAATPLGPTDGWSEPLRWSVSTMLSLPGPATILWGPVHIQLYNDAYIGIARDRHPALLGRPVAEGWPDAYVEVIAPLLNDVRAGRTTELTAFSVALQAADGEPEERVFDTSWSPIRDEGGRVEGALQTLTELTDGHRAKAALRASEGRFRAFVTASSDVVYRMSPDWSEMRQLDGRGFLSDTIEPSGTWMDRYIHAEDQPMVEAAIAQAIHDETMFELEHRVRRADGSLGWTRSRAVPIFNEGGEIAEWLGAASDVTVPKVAEVALRVSEERFRGLVEGFGQATWETSPDGRIVSDSPGWRAYTGQALEEWLGDGWTSAIHPEDRAETIRKWREAVEAKRAVDHEYRLWHAASASWRWSNVRAVPITNPDATIRKWVGVNIDIDDRRMLQERQDVLVAELQHRTRNLLGVVRSISAQTLHDSDTLAGFETAFNDRLGALSRVQGLLSRSEDEPITMAVLVRSELDALGAASLLKRVRVHGPDVRLRKGTVQTLALALHELATNARKYGALSNDHGGLSVTWRIYPDDRGDRRLTLDWIETGLGRAREAGSPVREVGGYGRELIERALPYALDARTSYDLGDTGLRCTIDLPLAERPVSTGR